MRIHSDTLMFNDFCNAKRETSRAGHGAVWFQYGRPAEHGSRKRAKGWEIKLEGDGSVKRRRVNQGTARNRGYGEDVPYAASYESWGWFLSYLYNLDPEMICPYYKDVDDFHARTGYAFVIGE